HPEGPHGPARALRGGHRRRARRVGGEGREPHGRGGRRPREGRARACDPRGAAARRHGPRHRDRRLNLTSFGPGKVILLGEHAVVYGAPALAGALERGVRAEGAPARETRLSLPKGLKPRMRTQLTEAFAAAAEA